MTTTPRAGLLSTAIQGQMLDFDQLSREEIISLFRKLQQVYQVVSTGQPSPEISHLDILDSLPMLITYIDRDLVYRFCNRAHRSQFGYDASGRPVESVVTAAFFHSVKPHIDRVLDGEPVNYRNVIYHDNGRSQWLDAEYVPDVDEQGNVRGFFTLVRDMTTRFEAEQRTINLQQITSTFAKAETQKQVLLVMKAEIIPMLRAYSGVVALLREDQRTIEIAASHNVTKETLAELQNLTINSPTLLAEAIRDNIAFWVEDIDHFHNDYPYLDELYQREGVQMGICLPLVDQGKTIGAISLSFQQKRIFDQTERAYLLTIAQQFSQTLGRVRFVESVVRERERFEVTLASIGDAVIATDPQGLINFMNPAAERMTGCVLADAMQQPLDQILRIKTTSASDTFLLARDGASVPIASTTTPIKDVQGQTYGTVIVFRDVRDRKQIENAERQQRILAEAFQKTAMAINSSLKLPDVVDQILSSIGLVVPHDAAKVILIEPDRTATLNSRGYAEHGFAEFEAILRQSPNLVERLTRLHQIVGTHEPLLIPDTSIDPHWLDIPEASGIMSFVGVPILDDDQVIGFIGLDSLTPHFFNEIHVSRLQVFAAQAAIAIKNAQLYQRIQEAVVVEERQRLSRDLHDAVSQMLFSSSMIAESLPKLIKTKPELMDEQLARVVRLNRGALAEMRMLLLELREGDLMDMEIPALLRQLADAAMGHSDLQIEVSITGEPFTMPPTTRIIVYRIAQEALNNILKHARASQVDLILEFDAAASRLHLKVCDNGLGFETSPNAANHLGLRIMQERAASIGAAFQVESQPGKGTEIHLVWQGE